MITTAENTKKHLHVLEETIAQAMSKVKAPKETELRYYIPWDGGYLHHLRFLRLKRDEPKELKTLIHKHILDKESPETVNPLPNKQTIAAPTESKPYLKQKRIFEFKLRRAQIDRLVMACEKAGPEFADLVELLQAPLQEKPSLEQVTKLMKKMLQDKRFDKRLLNTYEKLLLKT